MQRVGKRLAVLLNAFHCTLFLDFCTSSELFLGILLLYNFRILERHFGTVKFASLSLLSVVLGSFFNVILLAFARKYVSRLASGPFGLVMSLSVFYSLEIPTSYHIKIFGFKVSDHIFLSAILVQVSRGSSSLFKLTVLELLYLCSFQSCLGSTRFCLH